MVPLSCLANKMSHSQNLCKSSGNYAVWCVALWWRGLLAVAGICCVLAADLGVFRGSAWGLRRKSNVSRWTMLGASLLGTGRVRGRPRLLCFSMNSDDRNWVGAGLDPLFAAAADFEAIELAPVAPLGVCESMWVDVGWRGRAR